MGRGRWMTVAVAIAFAACDGEPVQPEPGVLFTIEVSGETFRTRVFDPEVIDALDARLASGTEGVVIGSLAPGDGGFNGPWGWHWEPASVEVAEAAIELCDGRPSMVQEDLDYWFESVGAFCPWGASVIARAPAAGGGA